MTDNVVMPVGKPEITFGISRNIFDWKEHELSIVADRITDDGVTELYFYHTNGSGKTLLHMGKANLLSSTMQRDFIKALSTRGLNLDWQTILTYISRDTIAHLREGEPLVWLNDDYGKTPPEYLLHPLFVKDAANIIYADRSSGKTLLITLLDLVLMLPWYDNPIGINISADQRYNVLFLDWEGNAKIMGWQKECIRRGMGVETCDIPYLHCSRSLADDVAHIQNKIEEVEATVVIIDSLGMAVGDDLNMTKPAFAFFSALRQLPVTPIIVAHTSKSLENRRKTVYGNAYYENEARSIWEVTKEQDYSSPELTVTLHHRKPPPFAALHDPMAWRFVFDGDKTTVESAEPQKDKRAFDDTPPSETDVALEILYAADKRISATELLKRSEGKIKATNIYTVLGRIIKKPEFKISKDLEGLYGSY